MLRQVRAHSQGLRLAEVLTNSPLAIVYQCIGNLKAAQLEDTLRADLPEHVKEPKEGLSAHPVSFRLKNSLASATGRPDVAAFLQATNILVGWELNNSGSGLNGAAALERRLGSVRRADRLADRAAQPSSTNTPQARQQPPQKTFAALIKASLELGKKYPVAPLAGFFHGQRISLADLQRWSELDDATVYGELLLQLGSPAFDLVQRISVGDAGISALLDAQAGPVIACLEAKAAEAAPAAAPA